MVEFFFSFFTSPLESTIQLLSGNSFLGSMDNLYKSVHCSKTVRADNLKNLLLKPSLWRGFHCRSNLLELNEEYYEQNKHMGDPYTGFLSNESPRFIGVQRLSLLNYVNLASPSGDTASGGGFLKRSATFMVTDNLIFTPLHSMWSFTFLKSMKFPLDDLEVRTVKALSLLKASLFSKSALADVFIKFGLKNPKQEK
ncbi:hypothetical protein NE237_005907 [Protea cynaroides]|uniref:Uncharacterized protein n=1 Tax=Protea cynaroides TaxID=273540 RepID=A0A9Q0QUT8_9MAGN|nr:hypothetical protein NE237_005907 [Protea cynaroides]